MPIQAGVKRFFTSDNRGIITRREARQDSTISKTLYGKRDLSRVESLEVASTDHSPIIGWAYDGNPIYMVLMDIL